MTEIRELLDREVRDLRAPEAWEPVHRRTRQRHRRRRLGAAVLALVVAGAGTAGAWLAIGGLRNNKNPKRPAAASWDGGRIAYQCAGGELAYADMSGPRVCTMRPDGTDHQLVDVQGSTSPQWDAAWSSDGSQMIYRASGEESCGCSGLYIADADGSNARRLMEHGVNAASPDWSPDGSTIAFDDGDGGSVLTVQVDGSGIQNLTGFTEEIYSDATPTWSPDSERIAFVRARSGGPSELWIMNGDGTDKHMVVSADEVGGSVAEPDWSPDGRLIAFEVRKGFDSTIWAYDAVLPLDGDPKNEPFLLAGVDSERNWAPEWIGGGAEVAFLHRGDWSETTHLQAVRLDDGRIRSLIPDFPGDDFSFQPPPGGAGGACVDPGPPEFISCSEAVQRAAYEGGTQGSRVEATLVQDDSGRWVWAVRYVDVHADDGSQPPEPVLQDWVMKIDARTGKFAGEHPVGPAVSDPNPLPEQSPA